MQRQGSFAQAEYAGKKKQTRRDKFLAEMERVVPWARLVERLQPLYPTGARGRPLIGSQGWHRYVGDRGDVLGVDRFGASAPGDVVMREYGFTVENVCKSTLALSR